MKSRSEVLKQKRAAAEGKPPAAERTVPLPALVPGMVAHCDECVADFPAEKCTTRADGFAECPACGAPTTLKKPAEGSPTRVDGPPAPAVAGPKNPEKKYCGTCGSEWSIVNGQFFINCGHEKAERIADPRKATKYGPPAPLGVRVGMEKERLDAEDAKRAPGSTSAEEAVRTIRENLASNPLPGSGPGPATLSGNRLSIPWGESRMPVDQWNTFKCGGHIITVEVPAGADRVEYAEKIIDDLEAIAERLFKRQKAWYEKKLGILGGNTK